MAEMCALQRSVLLHRLIADTIQLLPTERNFVVHTMSPSEFIARRVATRALVAAAARLP